MKNTKTTVAAAIMAAALLMGAITPAGAAKGGNNATPTPTPTPPPVGTICCGWE